MANRILFITSGMNRGGAETQLLKVAMFLRDKKYQIKIISLTSTNEFDIDYDKEKIPVVFLKPWKTNFYSNLKTLYSITKDYKPNVVIAFMFISIIFARLLKLVFRFKLISSIRTSVLPRKWYIPFKLTNGLDDEIIYNSIASKIDFETKKLINKGGKVIHNCISIPETEDLINVKSISFVWVCIAHFRWNKDYKTLFQAIERMKGLNFRVDIVGGIDKKYSSWANQFIEQADIGAHVRILGFRADAQHFLKQSNAFVLSSFSEGMPNALLEAMAHEKPVVVTDIDCNRLIVQSVKCGFLAEKQNAEDLAIKMKAIMEMTEAKRSLLGQNGRIYIEENFSEGVVLDHWLSTIKSLATA
ncbi:glycosyl transferase group 1 [Pseudopedobacter saltans DSM 12145]|uniref:Glycosyl transferase group 1 n=1 Tax=Pseudopedobacter saltans (strain ATCC 51119 / DSM 12145 / JCM 21818 / CCUG 39354 / LMG 10337 / NBRC 100064 / NCIMB 13643) TaxID=762903 RepID=F0S9P4_PSESL|nr:glycosyltransferase [Pseudopedobacter saltans]ADY51400.1 glycosyl transferase group 1 [Pseudopedobacter saltans DSM 12145]